MKKTLILVSSLLIATSASAFTTSETFFKLNDGNKLMNEKEFIKIDSFSNSGKGCTYNNMLSRDKDGNYLSCNNNKWKVINTGEEFPKYNVSVFVKDVNQKSLVSGTGVYDKDSKLVNLMPDNQYLFTSHANITAQKNKDNTFVVARTISYKEKATTEYEKYDKISKTESMGFFDDGYSINIIPDSKHVNIKIDQKNLESMNTFRTSDSEIEMPNIKVFKVDSLMSLPENKVARFDSGVYEKNGKQYQNVYLIQKQ